MSSDAEKTVQRIEETLLLSTVSYPANRLSTDD